MSTLSPTMRDEVARIIEDAVNSAIPEPWEVVEHATDAILALFQPTEEDVERVARSLNPDLFSDDPVTAHRAASPRIVEAAREPVRAQARAALRAYTGRG